MFIRIVLLLISFTSFCAWAEDQHSARLMVHLLDYLAKDYAGAVSPEGALLSESEFKEQVEFAETVLKASQNIPELSARSDLTAGIISLRDSIVAKAPPAEVVALARTLQQDVLEVTKLAISPTVWPNLEKASRLYADNCALCHGASGAGDGPAGTGLDPKPANFLDPDAMRIAAPLGAFHTIRLGVPGTGMMPFQQLSDDETWGLAFYVISLRYQKSSPAPTASMIFDRNLLQQAATLHDIDLARVLAGDENQATEKLTAVRLHSESESKVNTLALARTHLQAAEDAFRLGDRNEAKERALRSYLEGVEPVEPRLKSQAPELIVALETSMGEVRTAIESGSSLAEFEAALAQARADVERADASLQGQTLDAPVAFAAASGIILREGFEAALIILSLLSVIRALGARRAALWVHGGWLLAVLVGVAFWFFAGALFDISGAQRELLEGGTSLVAVLVLLALGFWMHRHSEIGRWTKFLKEKVHAAIDNKNLLGLAAISFIAVFREAFETVLFLRVLWFDAGSAAKTALLSGTGVTLAFIVIASWAAIRFSARLPVNRIFQLSTYIMAALAFILTGKGIHSLQESGLVSFNPWTPHLRWELIGVYPSRETLLAQAVTVAVMIFLWILGRKPTAA